MEQISEIVKKLLNSSIDEVMRISLEADQGNAKAQYY